MAKVRPPQDLEMMKKLMTTCTPQRTLPCSKQVKPQQAIYSANCASATRAPRGWSTCSKSAVSSARATAQNRERYWNGQQQGLRVRHRRRKKHEKGFSCSGCIYYPIVRAV